MALFMRKAVLTAKIESTYGTDAAPAGADAVLVRNLSVNPMNANLVGRDVVRPYYGNFEQIPVNASVECSCEIELAGSGSAGTAPKWSTLLRACAFALTLLASAHSGTATAATTTSVTLAAGASAVDNAYRGMNVSLTSGAASGNKRVITAYNGTTKVATVADPFSAAPGTPAYTIEAQASYAPVSTAIESATLYYNLDGVLHKILGARGNVQFAANAAGIPVMQFRFLGTYGGVTDTAAVTPDYSAFQVPKAVNIPNTPQFRLHGVSQPMSALSVDMANNLVFRSLPGGSEQVLVTDRRPAGSATFEATTIATKDWFTTAQNATTGPLSLIHGTVAGNIVQIEAPKVQITNPQYQDSDGIAMLQAGLTVNPVAGNDELYLITR